MKPLCPPYRNAVEVKCIDCDTTFEYGFHDISELSDDFKVCCPECCAVFRLAENPNRKIVIHSYDTTERG